MTSRSTRFLNIVSPLGLLVIWQLAVQAGLVDRRMFPPPSEILTTLFHMAETGELWINLGASLWRVGAGLAIGSTAGVTIGIIMGLSPLVRALVQPIISATYPVPRTAIVPLFLIIFGIGELSKVMVVATSVFYVVIINTVTGVLSIDKVYLDVGRDMKVSRLQAFRTIALPGALPTIISGLKLGAGIAFLVLVVAEYTGSQTGIGYMIWEGWQILDLDQMYVGLLVIAVIGWLVNLIMDEVEYFAVPWHRHR
ncbi:ABC transporter permease [Beijerinckia sp. L45]|uniref:ABC transporter permease n=1 Tax=Beijerinckia sp. L45 TaxID=1641855 RepID=UPI00131C38BB|nr:ABC transporter permease [Beijerinckia sp. L45]